MSSLNEDKVDRWLNTALRQHGSAAARAGLEARILANLKSAQSQASSRVGWIWALTGSVVAVAVVIAFLWLGSGSKQNGRSNSNANAVHPLMRATNNNQALPQTSQHRPIPAPKRTKQIVTARNRLQLVTAPRRSQFPSPRPLSPQELVLAEYVKRFPEEALLLAQEHKQFENEIEKAQQDAMNGAPLNDEER